MLVACAAWAQGRDSGAKQHYWTRAAGSDGHRAQHALATSTLQSCEAWPPPAAPRGSVLTEHTYNAALAYTIAY